MNTVQATFSRHVSHEEIEIGCTKFKENLIFVELMSDNAPYTYIFVAYASEDRTAADTFLSHLKLLQRELPTIKIWSTASLLPGAEFEKETRVELHRADIILLLVSTDSLSSSIYADIKLYVTDSAIIVPVLLRPCMWESDPFLKDFEPLPKNREFISTSENQEKVYLDITEGVKKLVQDKKTYPKSTSLKDGNPTIIQEKQKEAEEKDYENAVDEIKELPTKNISNDLPNSEEKEKIESPQDKKSPKRLKVIWGRIMAGLAFIALIAGLYADLPNMINDFFKAVAPKEEKISESPKPISPYGKPIFSKEDTLFKILIIRFEDDLNEDDDTKCVGRAIRKNLLKLERKKGLPITSEYEDKILSPDHPDKAKKIQEHHNADLLLYGTANKIQENCEGANMCFQRIIADTIMANVVVPDTINKVNHNFHKPIPITLEELQEGNYLMDSISMENWIRGLLALKKKDIKTYFAIIEDMTKYMEGLNDEEKANRFYIQGLMYSLSKKYEEAILSFEKAIELKPDFTKAHYTRGYILIYLGRDKEALNNLTKAIELDSSNAEYYHKRGIAYKFLDEYEKAYKDFNKGIERDSNNTSIIYERGLINGYTGNFEEAIKDFNKAKKAKSNNAGFYYNKGVAYYKIGKYEKAKADFTKAIELDSLHVEAYIGRAQIHNDSKDYDKAVLDYNEVIKLAPDAVAYYNRGNNYRSLKDDKKAIGDYTKATELNPNYDKAYNNRGIVYYNSKNYNAAIADFNIAIKLRPDALTYNNRGTAYQNLEEYKKAIADHIKAIELNPEFADAIKNLKKAIELGYDDKEFLQEEELLAPLRNHPEWQKILDSIKDKNSRK